jgi:hypothetical protein
MLYNDANFPFFLYHSQPNTSNMFLKGRALNWAITAVAGSGFLLFGYGKLLVLNN